MADRGVEITQHASTALSAEQIAQADHIFVMTGSHRDAVVSMVPSAVDRVALLLEGEDVRDPIGGSEEEYDLCAQAVERGVRARLQEVII